MAIEKNKPGKEAPKKRPQEEVTPNRMPKKDTDKNQNAQRGNSRDIREER